MSSSQRKRIAPLDFSIRSLVEKSTSSGTSRSPPWRCHSGLSSPSPTCGHRSRRSLRFKVMSQILGVQMVTDDQRRGSFSASYLPCTQIGLERLYSTALSRDTQEKRPCCTSQERCSLPSSGLRNCWTSHTSLVSSILNPEPIIRMVQDS